MFKKILVCLDGSKLAEQVLPYVSQTASRFGSKVELFQAMKVPTVSVPGEPELVPVEHDEIRSEEAEAADYLEHVASSLREKGLEVECVIVHGNPAEAIVAYAQNHEVDLIAIATHGRSGLGRLVFGSVADSVLRQSGLPILLIKPEETET
jgi:nucleotide-binding universal stress UspA family protein